MKTKTTKTGAKMKMKEETASMIMSSAGRRSNLFRNGDGVSVLWQGKRHKGAVSYTTECGPDVCVRLDENVGSKLENGHGVIVGWNSTDIQHSAV